MLQEIRDCTYADQQGRRACQRGWITKPLSMLIENQHLTLEEHLPYDTEGSSCSRNRKLPNAIGKVFKVTEVVNVGKKGTNNFVDKLLNTILQQIMLLTISKSPSYIYK